MYCITMNRIFHIVLALAVLLPTAVNAETKEEWITLGARVHGGFGPFIPVGIRIGLDAVDKLKAGPRGLTVTYYNGAKPPPPLDTVEPIADGGLASCRGPSMTPRSVDYQIIPPRVPNRATS
jgi:hypothetical protein